MDLPEVKDLAGGVQWALKAYHEQLRERPFGKDNPMNEKLVRDETQKKAGIEFAHVKPTPWVSFAKTRQLGATLATTDPYDHDGEHVYEVETLKERTYNI